MQGQPAQLAGQWDLLWLPQWLRPECWLRPQLLPQALLGQLQSRLALRWLLLRV